MLNWNTPYLRPSVQACNTGIQPCCFHCVVSVGEQKEEKRTRGLLPKAPRNAKLQQPCGSRITAKAGPPIMGGLYQPGQRCYCCRPRPAGLEGTNPLVALGPGSLHLRPWRSTNAASRGPALGPTFFFFLREGTSAVRQQGLMNNSNRHSQTRGRLAVPGCGELNRVFLSTVGSGTRTTFPQHGK